MGNGFRRIALAQGLLGPGAPSDTMPRWTDDALSALLQLEEAGTPGVVPAGAGDRFPCAPADQV